MESSWLSCSNEDEQGDTYVINGKLRQEVHCAARLFSWSGVLSLSLSFFFLVRHLPLLSGSLSFPYPAETAEGMQFLSPCDDLAHLADSLHDAHICSDFN